MPFGIFRMGLKKTKKQTDTYNTTLNEAPERYMLNILYRDSEDTTLLYEEIKPLNFICNTCNFVWFSAFLLFW